MKHDIAKLDPRFYDVINNLAFAPLAIQSLADTSNTPAKPKADNIDSLSIGHNSKARKRKDLAQKLASDIWAKHDSNQLLKIGDMVNILKVILPFYAPNLSLESQTDQTIRNYIKDNAPLYAQKKGSRASNQQLPVNKLKNHIIELYKTDK